MFSSHIICHRAMTRDEQMYPEPELFNPERFMNENLTEADPVDPKDFIFGFGRRQVVMMCPFHAPGPFITRECPGKVFADANVWLVSACIIFAFQAPVSRNEIGEKAVPPAKFTAGFVRCVRGISLIVPTCACVLIESRRHPVPFSCDIKPRSSKHSALIHHAVNSVSH